MSYHAMAFGFLRLKHYMESNQHMNRDPQVPLLKGIPKKTHIIDHKIFYKFKPISKLYKINNNPTSTMKSIFFNTRVHERGRSKYFSYSLAPMMYTSSQIT